MNGLARADDYDQVKQVCEYYADYKALFEGSGLNPGEKTLEDKFFEYEVISCACHQSIIYPKRSRSKSLRNLIESREIEIAKNYIRILLIFCFAGRADPDRAFALTF